MTQTTTSPSLGKVHKKPKDHPLAGKQPPTRDDEAFTVKELCNKFLTFKEKALQEDNLTERSLYDCALT